AIASAKVRWKGWDPVRFGKLLGGSPALTLAQKLEIATKIGKLPRKKVDELTDGLESARAQLQERLGSAADPMGTAFHQGYMDDLQNTHDIEVAAEALGAPALWTRLGDLLDEQGKYGESEVAYRKATEIDPSDAYSWFQLGLNLRELQRYAEAEGA